MPHLQSIGDDDPASHGHVHTVSATLLSCVSCNTTSPSPGFGNARSWNAPKSVLKRLLETSSQLPIDCFEIPPVQAWNQIRGHAAFEVLTLESLQIMSDKLLNHIKCYG
jgi:hypothetical protein